MDFFNSYENKMTVSFEYKRSDGKSVSGGDEYHIANLDTPDKAVEKEEHDDYDRFLDWLHEYYEKTEEDGVYTDIITGDIAYIDEIENYYFSVVHQTDNTDVPSAPEVNMNSGTPYVIVENYAFAGGCTQVTAGSDFMLSLNCINTHSKIDLENIIMKISTSDGLQLTSSSNTFFIDRLKRSAGFEKILEISALSAAEAKSHVVSITFEYEYIADGERKQGKMSQDISIPVVQEDRFSADPITGVAEISVGEVIDIVSKYMNKSRGQLYNLTAV